MGFVDNIIVIFAVRTKSTRHDNNMSARLCRTCFYDSDLIWSRRAHTRLACERDPGLHGNGMGRERGKYVTICAANTYFPPRGRHTRVTCETTSCTWLEIYSSTISHNLRIDSRRFPRLFRTPNTRQNDNRNIIAVRANNAHSTRCFTIISRRGNQ